MIDKPVLTTDEKIVTILALVGNLTRYNDFLDKIKEERGEDFMFTQMLLQNDEFMYKCCKLLDRIGEFT